MLFFLNNRCLQEESYEKHKSQRYWLLKRMVGEDGGMAVSG
jgi:hypothetical protein